MPRTDPRALVRAVTDRFPVLAGAFLLVSGAGKVLRFDTFLDALHGYRILADPHVPWVGAVVVCGELALALGLIVRRTRWWASVATALMLSAYAVLVAVSLMNHLDVSCGCLDPTSLFEGESRIRLTLVVGDVAAATALLACVALSRTEAAIGPQALFARLRSRPELVPVALAIALLGGETLYLLQNNRLMRERIDRTERATQALSPGDRVPPFETLDLDGRPGLGALPDAPLSFLVIFSTDCGLCELSVPRWNELFAARAAGAGFLAISLDSPGATRAWVAEHGAAFPVCVAADPGRVRADFRSLAVPKLYVVSTDGLILGSHTGALSPSPSTRARADSGRTSSR